MPEVSFIVPQPDVSVIIGMKGVQVKALEQETNTRIHLQNDTGMLSRDYLKLRNFKIIGEREDIAKGIVKIIGETIAKEHDGPFLQCILLPGDESDFSLQQGTIQHNEFKKELANVNQVTSSRIKPISVGPTGIFAIEILSISEADMEEALGKIMELYGSEGVMRETEGESLNREELIKLTKGTIAEQMEFLKEKEIIAFLIPEEKTSMLIGPKGSTIKELEQAFQVKLVVERPQAPFFATGRAVIIRGEVSNICECLAAAMDKLFERDNIDPRVVCLLPPGIPKYLIGHKGETITRIEQESGCSLKVQPAQLHSGFPIPGKEIKYCQIKGPRENIVTGIQGCVARVLLQLFLQGQTSHAAIPQESDFGVFGNFGRPADAMQGSSFGMPSAGRFGGGVARIAPGQDWSSTLRPGGSRAAWRPDPRGAVGDRYGGAKASAPRQWYPGSGGQDSMRSSNGGRDGYGVARGMNPPQGRYY